MDEKEIPLINNHDEIENLNLQLMTHQNKFLKVKENLSNILSYLTPTEEIFLIKNVKFKLILNYIKSSHYKHLISLVIRKFIYDRKFTRNKNKFQKNKTKFNNNFSYDYIFGLLKNNWNLSHILTSVIIHKPFFIPFDIYKSLGERINNLTTGFNSKNTTQYLIECDKDSIDVFLISNIRAFENIFSSYIKSPQNENTNDDTITYYQGNFLDFLDDKHILNLLKKINTEKEKIITINSDDLRRLYNLYETYPYLVEKQIQYYSGKKLIRNNTKQDYYNWEEFFNIQKHPSFYNTFFSYDHIIFNNAVSCFIEKGIEVSGQIAIFIHNNAELDFVDRELLESFNDATDEKSLMNVTSNLNMEIIKKKNSHLETYYEFNTQGKNQKFKNLKIMTWINLKRNGYHYLRFKPLFHYGRFIIIKFINCSSAPASFGFYGYLLEY